MIDDSWTSKERATILLFWTGAAMFTALVFSFGVLATAWHYSNSCDVIEFLKNKEGEKGHGK